MEQNELTWGGHEIRKMLNSETLQCLHKISRTSEQRLRSRKDRSHKNRETAVSRFQVRKVILKKGASE